MSAMLADMPVKVVDENAFTLEELSKKGNIGQSTVGREALKLVKSGKWEKVWKTILVNGEYERLVPAYRITKRHK